MRLDSSQNEGGVIGQNSPPPKYTRIWFILHPLQSYSIVAETRGQREGGSCLWIVTSAVALERWRKRKLDMRRQNPKYTQGENSHHLTPGRRISGRCNVEFGSRRKAYLGPKFYIPKPIFYDSYVVNLPGTPVLISTSIFTRFCFQPIAVAHIDGVITSLIKRFADDFKLHGTIETE